MDGMLDAQQNQCIYFRFCIMLLGPTVIIMGTFFSLFTTHNFRCNISFCFPLDEMQRYCHHPITSPHKLCTCYDLITFLFIQTFTLRVCFQIILTLMAISQCGCGRKWPLKWGFLCSALKRKAEHEEEPQKMRARLEARFH